MDDDDKAASSHRTRRGFLKLSAQATTAGALITAAAARRSRAAQLPAPTHVPVDEAAFPLGVASGDATATSAIVWTRFVGDSQLRLSAWTAEGQILVDDATEIVDGYAHILLSGLPADAVAHYAFFVVDERGKTLARSPVGRLRTPPPDDVLRPIVVGVAACTTNRTKQPVIEAAAKRRDLDVFLHLGDTVYCDGAQTLAQYRDIWGINLSTEGYRHLRASTSVLATWDDHEVVNDWRPETVSAELLATARRAFFEHQPVARVAEDRDRIWRKKRWGKTLEIFVLDSRSGRRRECSVPEYLDRAQMEWLKESLVSSDATFKLMMNTVPIARFPTAFAPNREERWESYPEARAEILSFIDANRIPGVVWVSGDFHLASVGRVSPYGFGQRALEVLAGPAAQFPNLRAAWLRGRQFDWASAENNYATLAFDPWRGEVAVKHFNRRGETIQASVHKVAPRARKT